MKKEVLLTVIGWFMLPMMIFGQTYSALWKKVEEAGLKDEIMLHRIEYAVTPPRRVSLRYSVML